VVLANKLLRLDASLARAAPAPPLPEAHTAKLDELRSRIQAVLDRSVRKPPPASPPPDAPDFPFAIEETPLGPLHVRTLRLLPSHRTGRAPILAARHASPELLGLLALDASLAGCDPAKALYVDTETTGLHGGTGTLAFLVGLAFWDAHRPDEGASGLIVEQLLLRRPGEEAPMLGRVAARMRDASMVVSFNGKAFDLPLLRTRFAMARIAAPPEPPHLDLVHVARRIHKARGGPCKLKAIEDRVLGFLREDDVPSSEVSAYYLHFLRTGDTRALEGVVEHNAWDVVTMASLVGLYGEPLETSTLSPLDLVGVGRTLFRAGERERGILAVERAMSGGAGDASLLARAEMAKRTGDRERALRGFEALVPSERVHLELAKLYEHYVKDPARALEVTRRGTGEAAKDAARRVERLLRKADRAAAQLSRRSLA
jgi:uncharacterized protein